MNTKKITALLICAVFLGLQCIVIFVPYHIIWGKNWQLEDKLFWPFLRYPMYADGKEPGDSFKFQELRIKNKDGKGQSISYSDLHLMNYRFDELMWSMRFISDSSYTPKQSNYDDFKLLSYLIRKYISQNTENIELWTKTYKLTTDGIENFNVDWKLELSRKIFDDSSLVPVVNMKGAK